MATKSTFNGGIAALSKPHHQEWFGHFARVASNAAGKPIVFIAAVVIVLIWALLGPMFGFSDTWQLVINTGTTIITFLMVFLIQNTQNRDQMAVQLKLGELILAIRGAENRLAVAEEMSDEELESLHEECKRRADHVFESLSARRAAKQAEHQDKAKNGKSQKAGQKAHADAK
jgi:low affinity Fe/Cu permease